MANLGADDLAIAEQWLGPLSAAEKDDVGDRIVRLVDTHVAVLEHLLTRYSGVISDPLKYRVEGDAAYEFNDNVGYLKGQINRLSAQVRAELTHPTVAQQLVLSAGEAVGSPVPVISADEYQVKAGRPFSAEGWYY